MRGKAGGFPKLPYLNFGYPHPLDGFSLVESAKKSLLNRLLKSILTASQEKILYMRGREVSKIHVV